MVEFKVLEILYFCPHCGWRLAAHEPCKMPIRDFVEITEIQKRKHNR